MTTEAPYPGAWSQTEKGIAFRLLEPRAEDVHLSDISYSLSNICRFNGHCRPFYSVAEHCVRVADLVQRHWNLEDAHDAVIAALMHDAAECYIGDIIRPLKQLPGFAFIGAIESRIMEAVGERFGFNPIAHDPLVHWADATLLATEKRDLMAPEPQPWVDLPTPLDTTIWPMSPERAENEFLTRMWRYSKARGNGAAMLYASGAIARREVDQP